MNEEKYNNGWIKLHRSYTKSSIFKDIKANQLFIYCLLRANHQKNFYQGTPIEAGSFTTSLDIISSETSLSVQEVRTQLRNLKNCGAIIKRATNRYTMITLVNWEPYQTPLQKSTNKQQTNNNQTTTNKNDNNGNNSLLERDFYNVIDFLSDWNKIRSNADNVSSKINSLKDNELVLFNNAVKKNNKTFIQDAIKGMFRQKDQMPLNRIRPKHFLENIELYKDSLDNNIKLF